MINELSFFEDYEIIESIRNQLESLREQGLLSDDEAVRLPRPIEGGYSLSDAVEYEEDNPDDPTTVTISANHFLNMSDREVMEFLRESTLKVQ